MQTISTVALPYPFTRRDLNDAVSRVGAEPNENPATVIMSLIAEITRLRSGDAVLAQRIRERIAELNPDVTAFETRELLQQAADRLGLPAAPHGETT